MTQVQQQRFRPLTGQCYASDREILTEIAEGIPDIGDVRYDSVVIDSHRRQITAKLEDGRILRLTMVIE